MLLRAARWVEACGLWYDRSWAGGLVAISAGIYLPFELVHWLRHAAASALLALVIKLWSMRC
jgi:uncharacterized membrane protein (DUF2068 family)